MSLHEVWVILFYSWGFLLFSSFVLKVWYFVSNYIMNHKLASKLKWEGEKERLKCVESSALKPFLKEKKCFCLTLICRKPESWTIIVKLLICPYILDTIASDTCFFCSRLNEKRIPRTVFFIETRNLKFYFFVVVENSIRIYYHSHS